MKRGPWSAAEEARLRELYPRTRSDELPGLLGRSHSSIKNRAAAMHLRKTPEASMRRAWSRTEDAVLRARYANAATAELCGLLGRTKESIYGRADKLGLNKSSEYMKRSLHELGKRLVTSGAGHRFKKGQIPPNKGLRRPGWGPGRMKQTQFKKGQAGWNWRPVGTERLVDGYRYTKVRDRRRVPWTKNWEATHILLWEKHHGRRLDRRTHALRFKNGDRLDVRLENLELITRRANMQRNSVHNLPKPLAHAVQLLGALKRKINRRSRAHEKQDRRSA